MATALAKIAAHRHIGENGARYLCDAVQRAFRKRPPPDEMIAACVRSMGTKTTFAEIAMKIATSKTYAKWLKDRHVDPILNQVPGTPKPKRITLPPVEPFFQERPKTERPKQGQATNTGQPIWKRVGTGASVDADNVTRKDKLEDW